MIIFDVPPMPVTASPGFVLIILLSIFLVLLLGLGIFLLVKFLQKKGDK